MWCLLDCSNLRQLEENDQAISGNDVMDEELYGREEEDDLA